jgi:integration host factor subunit beta|tara:strand:+ start:860 stop:1150 length:291 start_codon:yes stop_codon:yes gene_type:complete
LAVVKSNLLKQLADGYPNFLRKDLSKLLDIILNEMENALKKGERVELRDIFTLETRIQKARISRNPKTNEKIETPNKRVIHFKMSKEWFKKINNNE